MVDPRDRALQSVTPTVMVPRYTDLEELETPGQRLLMAANGVWLEVCRAWLYVRMLVAEAPIVPVPYGQVTGAMRFKCGGLPKALVSRFIEEASGRCPNECAAWVVWNQKTGAWRLQMLEEISSGLAHVENILPTLADDEHMVIDLHSHGVIPEGAFFSSEDNADDTGDCKIAGVVGNLDREGITTAFRLCVNGVFIPLPFESSNEQGV